VLAILEHNLAAAVLEPIDQAVAAVKPEAVELQGG